MSNTLMPMYVAIIVGLITLITTALVALANAKSQLSATTLQARQQAFSGIMGLRHLRTQLIVSRSEALVSSDLHEYRWHAEGDPMPSQDYDEAARWMHKSEDLALEFAKSSQTLFEKVGLVRTSFPESEELDTLVERLYRFGTPTISPPKDPHDMAAVAKWKLQAVAEVQQLAESEYGRPIDDLLDYLKKNLHSGL